VHSLQQTQRKTFASKLKRPPFIYYNGERQNIRIVTENEDGKGSCRTSKQNEM
jgi:hypothetical protein